MKRIIMGAVILIAILVTLVACNNPVTTGLDMPCEVELLLPGNTVVIGTCTEIMRQSGEWIKLKINDRWYACSQWRVTLMEGVIK